MSCEKQRGLKRVPKPTLTFDDRTHTYSLRGLVIPSVTQVMGGVNQFLGLDEEMLRTAQERGTAVHQATVLWDRGEPFTARADLDPYLNAWLKFLDDVGFEPVAIEQVVHHPRHRYAGTLDRVGAIAGVMSVLEIKTSAILNPITALQLAAYKEAYNAGRPPERAKGRYAVQLRKDGTYRLHEYKDAADLSVFLACLLIHNWRLRHG